MLSLFQKPTQFAWSFNGEGLAIRFAQQKDFVKAAQGKGDERALGAFLRMQVLAECGDATIEEVDSGIFVATGDAVRLDEDSRDLFELPPAWPGGMRLTTDSVPQLPDFRARLVLMDPVLHQVTNWKLRGPILQVGDEFYLPTPAQYTALLAYSQWKATPSKTELDHFALVASLTEAHEAGCMIDLEAYRSTGVTVAKASELVIAATEDAATGDLYLCPIPQGRFNDIEVSEMRERIGQLQGVEESKILRVGNRIVLLDSELSQQAKAVVTRSRVPKSERANFERDSSTWLSNHVFPDIPIEFSPRVIGIGELKVGYLGAGMGETEDWFGKLPSPDKPETTDKSTKNERGEGGEFSDDPRSVPDEPEAPKSSVLHPLIITNDTELGFGWNFAAALKADAARFTLDLSQCTRTPLPHQEKAIHWIFWHAKRSLESPEPSQEAGTKGFGAGALLADDMGLGKTFSTLMGIGEWLRHWRKTKGSEPPAVLIVAPLSLVLNWKDEIEKAFGESSPFNRVVLAQPDLDLNRFLRAPGAKDVAEPGEVKAFGLCFGDKTERSLDYPGSCVITTYQTVRDYRFSFAAAEWSAAIYDEAQHIKNPNAQQTIAVKSLRARFRLSMTGTPVENHLGDFWCIVDAAEPGPLGSYSEFRRKWIASMQREREKMDEIGKALKEFVGDLMLRRTKEDCLKDLPAKSMLPVLCPMTDEQIQLYQQARDVVVNAEQDVSGVQLAALWHLRQISLHPDLLAGGSLRVAHKPEECRSILCRSGKLAWLLNTLDAIQKKGEKVLIFCVLKHLQEKLAHHLEIIYQLRVPIINGDTKSSSKTKSEETRLGLIERFSNDPGFGICILSPIAAGAGLNIVAANHVIHLERHWNPAKEDQATDRVYRIGQKKPVTVYLPAANHPDYPSFDVILHGLLERKRSLQGALGLIPPEAVSGPELMHAVFSDNATPRASVNTCIDLEQALHLSWKMFEALIAVIYQREAEEVILTPHVSDHGADVVVLGWGPYKHNLIIECKSTSLLSYDRETGVRQVASSVPFIEKPLGLKFDEIRLHTTAKKFNSKVKKAADLCKVKLHGREWLSEALKKYRLTMAEVMTKEGARRKVG